MGEFFLRALGVFLLCSFCVVSWGAADAIKRPMLIHRVSLLGLEIWTEARPEWDVHIDLGRGSPSFVAETPALSVPPAGMSWTTRPDIAFTAEEIEDGARGAIQQVAWSYGLRESGELELRPASYGDLTGYESVFSGDAHGTPVDVQIFCGHRLGKPAVLMQAYTLKGKLSRIAGHIRRSWTHVRYLQ
jgi:hypothetical protein